MRLTKPMYGLTDPPRLWFLEATDRMKASELTRHPLDTCLFLAHDNIKLVGLVALHVDVMTGDPKSFAPFRPEIQNRFGLRTFKTISKEGQSFDYFDGGG